MLKIDINQAQTNLSRYVKMVAQGKEIVITRDGEPVALIAPLGSVRKERKLGLLDKKARIPDNFNRMLSSEELIGFLSDNTALRE